MNSSMDVKKFECEVADIHNSYSSSEGISHKTTYIVPPQNFHFLNTKITSHQSSGVSESFMFTPSTSEKNLSWKGSVLNLSNYLHV